MTPIRWMTLAALMALAAEDARAAGWKLGWSDEFNGAALDPAVWTREIGYLRNKELQYYSNRAENARLEDGALLIQARRDNWNGHAYTSASLTTRGRKSFKYGRFEMRGRIDIRSGSWPAWWWLPDNGGWPKGGEIDMMEFYRGMCLFNVMDGSGAWSSIRKTTAELGGPRWAEEYHTWTMVWDSTRIQLSLDGVLLNDYPLSKADGTGPNRVNPFRMPGYLILNQAIGGTQGGDPTATAFPVDLRVDWVRTHVWDSAATGRHVKVNGGAGSGMYAVGTLASVTANWPPEGKEFDRWVVGPGTATLSSPTSPSATLTVPSADVTVTATYRTKGTVGLRPPRPCRVDLPVLDLRDLLGRRPAASLPAR